MQRGGYMMKHTSQKEELLYMLNEIYGQLEELDAALETSLSKFRGEIAEDHQQKMIYCESRMAKAEKELQEIGKKDGRDLKVTGGNDSIKLELGY
jgi:exonuclease VII small subunit